MQPDRRCVVKAHYKPTAHQSSWLRPESDLPCQVVEVVTPERERLDAVCIFPSMPAVMQLNKIGSFTMASMGQSKNVISDFMKKNKPKGTSFQDGMLKLVGSLHSYHSQPPSPPGVRISLQ